MHYEFTDVFDNATLRQACEAFTIYSGMGTAILDLNGIIHAAAGWQEICTNFHRVNEHTAELCRESDTELANQLQVGDSCRLYRCKNGLVDAAIPIHVGGAHIGNFFIGQFLLEAPDLAFFERQADTHQFDKSAYMDSLKQVLVLDQATVERTLNYLVELTQIIGRLGLEKYHTLELARRGRESMDSVTREIVDGLENTNAELRARVELLEQRLGLAPRIPQKIVF